MSILKRIHIYLQCLDCDGKPMNNVPLTNIEVNEIISNDSIVLCQIPTQDRPQRAFGGQLFGKEVFPSPFAEEMRTKHLAVEMTQFVSEATEVDYWSSGQLEVKDWIAHELRCGFVQLRLKICTDTTHLNLTFEVDPWAFLKKKLHLTRWFPIKTKTIKVDGRVLYPYLKIQLPHNKHHVQLNEV